MSVDEFHLAVKTGDLANVVVLHPDDGLNFSFLLKESVLGETKAARYARSGSPIIKNTSYPYYPLVKIFQDVVCHNPP